MLLNSCRRVSTHSLCHIFTLDYSDNCERTMALKSKYADVSIPETLSWPDFVFRDFEKYGNQTAIICGATKREYTFSQVRDLSRRVASALSKRGLRKGNVVALFAPNVPEFPIVFLGALQIGAVVTGVNPFFTTEELTNQLEAADAVCIITVHQLEHRAKEAAKKLGIDHMFVLGDDVEDGYDLVSILFNDDGSSLPHVTFNPKEDLAILPYSSGTSGLPKCAMVTHYNLVALGCIATAHGFMDFKQITTEQKNSTTLAFVPFHRPFGLIAVLSLSLQQGSCLVSVPRFEQNRIFNLLQDYKVTLFVTEASVVHLLSIHPAVNNTDLSSLAEVISTSSLLSKETSKSVRKRLPHLKRINQCYGMTENTALSHMTPPLEERHGSVGVLLPNLECKVCDVSTGQVLGAGERGEICVKGPTMMKGYLNDRDASQQIIDGEGWLHTGDLGYYDQDEHFFIVDKLKDLIKFRGDQVSPSELEVLLKTHPAVFDAAVIGFPDPEVGELPTAFVVSMNEEDLTEMEVIQYVDENAATHKKLRGGVMFINSIPRSEEGEILRTELRDKMIQGKYKPVQMRRGSLFGTEENKRFSIMRNSLPMTRNLPRNNETILEEESDQLQVPRSKSCVIL